MIRINADEVRRIRDEMRLVNRTLNAISLDKIEWVDDGGNVIPVHPGDVKDFKFTGLNTSEFVEMVIEAGVYPEPAFRNIALDSDGQGITG